MAERSFDEWVQLIVERSLAEDIGTGDVTTIATIAESLKAEAVILCKENGVLTGALPVIETYRQVDNGIAVDLNIKDGDLVSKGQEIACLSGPARGILTGERTALNFLQRLSGIATLTRRYVDAVRGTKAIILDTRKTTPGLRILEKHAVRCGGGYNHRMGLFDMVMVKDNHIAAAGSITNAVNALKKSNCDLKIEVECKNLAEVRESLDAGGVDRVMLDNMTLDAMREAVGLVKGRVELEASGGVNLETVRDIALTGVDYISVGALTHSAKALDFSLEVTSISS